MERVGGSDVLGRRAVGIPGGDGLGTLPEMGNVKLILRN
jgi:hypothetical protein